MSGRAYADILIIARQTPRSMPAIVVDWGAAGEQYAATRVARGGAIHMRRWMTPTGRWAKWRKLESRDVLRIATLDDIRSFGPDYGTAWERDK